MNITKIVVKPLKLPLKKPYIWSQGVETAFFVNLIEVHSECGKIGYGETTAAPDVHAQAMVIQKITKSFIGQSVFDYSNLMANAYKASFLAFGANMPRYANQIFSGLDMACLDLQGKILGRPVWDLLGGSRRAEVGYFDFLQGDTIDELVDHAKDAVSKGAKVIYLKVGIEPERDIQATSAVREAIGAARLRLDANEAWDPLLAIRMLKRLEPFDIEYIEQPTSSVSLDALKMVADRSPIPIGADQAVFTLTDVYEAVKRRTCDMIAVGPREIGGLRPMIKAAGIAEAAGLKICIHSSMTTGITTCAEHHVARAIPNLDDGNQIMWQLLEDDIVENPDLQPKDGALALKTLPGLGFTLKEDVVARYAEAALVP